MGGWGFGYDTLNRLQSSSVTSGTYTGIQTSWGYDAFGNRTSENFSGSSNVLLPTASSASYNTNNQISGSSLMLGAAVQYDALGDVTADNQNQYLYDGDGRMCAVRNTYTGAMTGYIYGADGTRVSTGSISTWGSCDPAANGYQALKDSILGPSGGQLTETGVDANGNVAWAHTNVWVGGQLLATYDPNGLHFYLNDWTGSRRVQTDYEGVVEQTCTNLPYGDGVTCGANPTEQLFAGLERDSESGLDHAMFRQYSSTFGRWTSPDPYGGSVYNPQSLNRYAYVNGSPLGATDRSGLFPIVSASLWWNANSPYTIAVWSFGDSEAASALIGDAAPIAFGFAIFELGKDFGWWAQGPQFHGNVAASQSGKYVPNAPQGDVPLDYDIFHCSTCASTWNSAAGAVGPQGIAAWYGASAVGAGAVLGAPAAASWTLNASGALGPTAARVFYSAIGATAAAEAAQSPEIEGFTLEMSPLGGLANSAQQLLNKLPMGLGQNWFTGAAWNGLSSAFASGAEGPVTYLQGPYLGPTWYYTEMPILLQNGNPINVIPVP
jgi:RHS repeat-associated protein